MKTRHMYSPLTRAGDQLFKRRAISAWNGAVAILILSTGSVPAQSLGGYTVGQSIAGNTTGAKSETALFSKIVLSQDDGAQLSIVSDRQTETILSIDLDNTKAKKNIPVGYGKFVFGVTNLGEVRGSLGSAGVLFKEKSPVSVTPTGDLRISYSFELTDAKQVVTFTAVIGADELLRLKSQHPADLYSAVEQAATLAAMEISDTNYAEVTHGPISARDGNYTRVAWQPKSIDIGASPKLALGRIKSTQFPVFQVYHGPNNFPDFSGRDAAYRTFQSRITDAMMAGPTFAGEYAIVQFGCGTGCSMGYVGNVRTGEVFPLPFGGSSQYLSLKYQLDSRLLIAQSAQGDPAKCLIDFYGFDDGEWTKLFTHEIGREEQCHHDISESLGGQNG